MIVLWALALLLCTAAVVVPFRPFQKRWQAALATVVVILFTPPQSPSTTGTASLASIKPTPTTSPAPCADQKACDEANKIAYSSPRSKELQTIESTRDPHRQVYIDNFKWHLGGFGTVMIASFRLSNKLAFPVKDIDVSCDVAGASGTGLGTVSKTIYQTVAAGKTRHIKEFNFGLVHSQSQRAGCRVTGVTPVRSLLFAD